MSWISEGQILRKKHVKSLNFAQALLSSETVNYYVCQTDEQGRNEELVINTNKDHLL